MLKKRIIACLDVKDGRTVKGVNFVKLKDAGDPVEMASKYAEQGIDELVFLDISATGEKRKTMTELVKRVAEVLNIPFTVGGGIASESDVHDVLMAGADKVSLNSAAVRNPELIEKLAVRYGSQCVVIAIDARKVCGRNKVFIKGGEEETPLELLEWAKQAQECGAGEVLYTGMDFDGTGNGYDIEGIISLSKNLSIPVIASGGAGNFNHFYDAFSLGGADAALAAGVFHYGKIAVPDLKEFLKSKNIPIR
jgi:cyclase